MKDTDRNKKTWAEWLSSAHALAFISCFTAGVLTHLYALTNKIPNWDDITDVNWFGMGTELGRWLLPHVWRMSTSYSAPAVHGLQAIALVAAAAAVCIAALGVRDRAAGVLTGVSFAVFPALVSGMTYMFTVHCYALAILMSVFGAYITIRFRKFGWIGGMVLLFLSLSIYQAFYVFASGIFVMSLMGDMAGDEETAQIVKKGLKYLAVLLVSIFSYILFVRIAGFELISYRGADDMGVLSLSRIPLVIARSYHRFIQYFVTKPDSYIGAWTLAFMRGMFVLAYLIPAAAFIRSYRRKGRKDVLRVFLFFFCLWLTPVAMGGVYIMASGVQKASTIMIYPYVLIFVMPFAVLRDEIPDLSDLRDRLKAGPAPGYLNRAFSAMCLCFYLLIVLCSYQFAVLDGSAYFRSSIAMERVKSLYNRIMVRLEEQEGFSYGDRILICGDWWPEKNILSSYELNLERFKDLDGVADEHGFYTSGVRRQFIRTYLGVDYDNVYEEEGLAIEATQQYRDMPVWPDQGCVSRINDVWVVKMHD